MIELDEDSYILGFWFAHDEPGNDWMCCVKKQKGEERWKGWYRFRDRKDDKFANSKDVKRWVSFESKIENSEEHMIKTIDSLHRAVQARYPYPDILLIQGGLKDLVEKAKGKDWMQMRTFEVIQGGKT